MSGYYLMYRGWMEHPVFGSEAFTRAQAWEWLIGEAAWKDRSITVGFKQFSVLRGQLCKSVRTLAAEWKWDQSKVFRFLSRLEAEKMIETDNETGMKRISICNYDQYQSSDDGIETPDETPAKQQRNSGETSLKKVKKVKKDISSESRSLDESISSKFWESIDSKSPVEIIDGVFDRWFWSHYPERKGPKLAARKAFHRALKSDNAANIIVGAGHYLAKRESLPQEDWQYTAHASTWLNQQRWRDEIEEMNAELEARSCA